MPEPKEIIEGDATLAMCEVKGDFSGDVRVESFAGGKIFSNPAGTSALWLSGDELGDQLKVRSSSR